MEKKDKWANYTSAADLGIEGLETDKTSYEIEQELRGRAGEAGAWEEVTVGEPSGLYTGEGTGADEDGAGAVGYKRKLGEYAVRDDEDHESFRIEQKAKRPVRDPYDDDDTDFRQAFRSLSKKKDATGAEMVKKEEPDQGLDRGAWAGKLELLPDVKGKGKEELKQEDVASKPDHADPAEQQDAKPAVAAPDTADSKPDIKPETVPGAAETAAPESTGSNLFRKRRPAPSSRKK